MNIGEKKVVVAEGYNYSLDDFETKLSNNILVLGSTGCGKTRGFVKPNLLQAYGSYIISDPKGNLYYEFKDYLKKQGYDVYLLDFKKPSRSSHYNPLEYIKTEEDIKKVAKIIIECNEQASSKDPYWAKAGTNYIAAAIALVKMKFPKERQNINEVADIVYKKEVPIFSKEEYFKYYKFRESETGLMCRDDNEVKIDNEKCIFTVKEPIKPVDIDSYFKYLKEKNPCIATTFYSQMFSNNNDASTTKECIYMEGAEAVSGFVTKGIRSMLEKNDFDIKDIANKKTAVFVSASDTDRSLDTIVNIFYSQCLNELCDYADNECKNSRLPIDVRFMLDDFATNCKINDFDKSIAMIRSRGISATIMLQDVNQLRVCYGDGAGTIRGNCDTWIYLGGNDVETASLMAMQVNLPFSTVYEMNNENCYVYRRGEKPYKAKKINYDEYYKKFLNKKNERSVA